MNTTVETVLFDGIAPLTLGDRCDSCGAAGRVRVVLASGELVFCGHHAGQHLSALQASGLIVGLRDERDWYADSRSA